MSIPIFLTGKKIGFGSILRLFDLPLTNVPMTIPLPPPSACRNHSVHIHTIPFDAGHHNQRADRHWHRVLWLCHGSQCVHLAKGENDMRAQSESAEFEFNGQSAPKSVTKPAGPAPAPANAHQYNQLDASHSSAASRALAFVSKSKW